MNAITFCGIFGSIQTDLMPYLVTAAGKKLQGCKPLCHHQCTYSGQTTATSFAVLITIVAFPAALCWSRVVEMQLKEAPLLEILSAHSNNSSKHMHMGLFEKSVISFDRSVRITEMSLRCFDCMWVATKQRKSVFLFETSKKLEVCLDSQFLPSFRKFLKIFPALAGHLTTPLMLGCL